MHSYKRRLTGREVPSEIRVVAMKTARNFLIDESGATAIEYGLMSPSFSSDCSRRCTTFNGNIVGYYERIVAAMMAAFGMSP